MEDECNLHGDSIKYSSLTLKGWINPECFCVAFTLKKKNLYINTKKSIYSSVTTFISSIQFNCLVVFNSLLPHGLQHARFPCPLQFPEFAQFHVHQVGDAIQPSYPLLSLSPSAFNLSQHQESYLMIQFFASGGQIIGASALASVLPMNIQN